MLRNVLADYLSRVSERQLDLPLFLLLPAMGFYDVHYTHGSVEFGKDFIAKRVDGDAVIQYAFQSKVGDISQASWRSDIMGQLTESLLSNISHPNFDSTLDRRVVLITTGEMKGNAAVGFQDFNRTVVDTYRRREVFFWGQNNLIDLFAEYGISGLLHTTVADYVEHARFFIVYGRAIQGFLTDRDIETHSRGWIVDLDDIPRRLLRAALEAEAISLQCVERGRLYESVVASLALIRSLAAASYSGQDALEQDVFDSAVARVYERCMAYIEAFKSEWEPGRDLVGLGKVDLFTYLVHCARTIEIASLAVFSAPSVEAREAAFSFLDAILEAEGGCYRPPSDRYTVSVVMSVLALLTGKRTARAEEVIRRVTVWLCDRYEHAMGIAPIEATESQEVSVLIGYPFDFIDVQRTPCLMATSLCDLAAFTENAALYGDIVNDLLATNIFAEYWQASDTMGACGVEARDVTWYASVNFKDILGESSDYDYADHIRFEPGSYQFAESWGSETSVFLMALLRDRYFPKLWPSLMKAQSITHVDTPK